MASKSEYQTLLDQVIEDLPKTVELIYVAYDDKLMDEQIEWALNDDIEKLWESLEEFEFESRWHGVAMYMNDIEDEVLEELKDLFNQEVTMATLAGQPVTVYEPIEEIRQALEDRDESDPFMDLLRNTPDQHVRYFMEEAVDTTYSSDEDEFEEQIQVIADRLGIDLALNRENLLELLYNASYGGGLYIFWKGDLSQLVKASQDVGGRLEPRQITWNDPYVLVFDRMNGSGHMVKITGTVTEPYDPEQLHLDVGTGSWSDWVCGGLYGCDCDVTITPREVADDRTRQAAVA